MAAAGDDRGRPNVDYMGLVRIGAGAMGEQGDRIVRRLHIYAEELGQPIDCQKVAL